MTAATVPQNIETLGRDYRGTGPARATLETRAGYELSKMVFEMSE